MEMMDFFTALGMAASMFTMLPLPKAHWEERLRPLATALLPIVGLGVGLIWSGIAVLACLLPRYLRGALIAAVPWLLTGFIHLDGYMDTCDALLSWRSQQECQRILKDVHVGAFAVVALVLLAMFQFAAAMDLMHIQGLIMLPVLSRCGSAFCALTLHPLGQSEYTGMTATQRLKWLPVLFALFALVAITLVCGWRGLIMGIIELASYAFAMTIACRLLGGFSGDLAGFALTLSELCGLIALTLL